MVRRQERGREKGPETPAGRQVGLAPPRRGIERCKDIRPWVRVLCGHVSVGHAGCVLGSSDRVVGCAQVHNTLETDG